MIYRIDYLGLDAFGRMRLRGTGFDPKLDGVTWIHPEHLKAMYHDYERQLEAMESDKSRLH